MRVLPILKRLSFINGHLGSGQGKSLLQCGVMLPASRTNFFAIGRKLEAYATEKTNFAGMPCKHDKALHDKTPGRSYNLYDPLRFQESLEEAIVFQTLSFAK